MRGNRDSHRILCGPKGSGKSTLVRKLATYAHQKGAFAICVDAARLQQTPMRLLQDQIPELTDCTTLDQMFEVLVARKARVLLIIDEIHYISRERSKGWTQEIVSDLHMIGTTEVERSNVLCILTGSSAYTLQLLHAQLEPDDATALKFYGYAACTRLINLNHQKFVAETIGLAEPTRDQMKQMLQLVQFETRDEAHPTSDHSAQEDDGDTVKNFDKEERSDRVPDEQDETQEVLTRNVDDELKRIFGGTAGLIGSIALVAQRRPNFVRNLLIAIENNENTFETAEADDIEEVLEEINRTSRC
jgi:hypothetical protein